MFDRPRSGERAVLVHLEMADDSDREDPTEFRELALAAGVDPVAVVTGPLSRPNARLFVGTGKLQEIREAVVASQAEVVLVNHPLSPSQERNLEKELSARVLDRTGLILDIFAQRARTHEGKLQVELAQLEHLSTRLVRGWTHLERQKGGIGLRGPGETQLETDRRLLRARIKAILKRLEKVRTQRDQGRRARRRAAIPTLSLVGYTNAGKSTLFNRLTAADVFAADQLFATLDPTIRRVDLAEVGPVVFADTVGFIRHLPHKLVDAFRATLEETTQADLLLHVVDASDPRRLENMEQVDNVLLEIGAEDIPRLLIMNKIDRLPGMTPQLDRDASGRVERVWLSAVTGEGLPELREALRALLGQDMLDEHVLLQPSEGRLRAQLYQRHAVVAEHPDAEGGFDLHVRLPRIDWIQLLRQNRPPDEQASGQEADMADAGAPPPVPGHSDESS